MQAYDLIMLVVLAMATIFGAINMTRKEITVLEHDPRGRVPSGMESVKVAAVSA